MPSVQDRFHYRPTEEDIRSLETDERLKRKAGTIKVLCSREGNETFKYPHVDVIVFTTGKEQSPDSGHVHFLPLDAYENSQSLLKDIRRVIAGEKVKQAFTWKCDVNKIMKSSMPDPWCEDGFANSKFKEKAWSLSSWNYKLPCWNANGIEYGAYARFTTYAVPDSKLREYQEDAVGRFKEQMNSSKTGEAGVHKVMLDATFTDEELGQGGLYLNKESFSRMKSERKGQLEGIFRDWIKRDIIKDKILYWHHASKHVDKRRTYHVWFRSEVDPEVALDDVGRAGDQEYWEDLRDLAGGKVIKASGR